MKIGVFLFDLNSGGAEKIMVSFMNYLCENGTDEVVLILTRKTGPYISLLHPNIKVISLEKQSSLKSILPLFRYLRDEKVDVLYSTLRNANMISIIVGRLLKIRTIIREANTFQVYSETKKGLMDSVTMTATKIFYKYAYKCIAISNSVKLDLIKYTNCNPSDIQVIYNPIIIFDNIDNINLDSDYFHVGLVSRLSIQKNIPTVCKLIEKFLDKDIKIKFHFFGEGNERVLLEKIQCKPGGENIITLHGFELSYFSYLKKMNVFLHIPLWEGLGNSVLEAYNSGIPMLLSDVNSGFSELILKSYSNIHYFDPTQDIDEMFYIISKYINDSIPLGDRPKLDLSPDTVYKSYRELAN